MVGLYVQVGFIKKKTLTPMGKDFKLKADWPSSKGPHT